MFRDGNPPPAPTNLAVTSLNATTYRLNWTDNSTDEMRFRIERTPAGQAAWAEIGTAAANAVTYTDTTAASGTNYQYRVLSDNGNGRSVSNVATPLSPLPAPPSGLLITASSLTSAALHWTDSSNETQYRIMRAPAASNTWSDLGTVDINVTTFTDNTVPDGNSYRYQVFAENASGLSVGSNIAILPAMPAAPGALAATGLSPTALKLDWTDNATSEDGYKVDRAPAGGPFTQLVMLPGTSVKTYTDASVPASGEYQYRVYAYNARGNSAYSGVVDGLPAKPVDISNTVINNGQIDLKWTDSSSINTGYKIERSLDGGANYQLLATLPGNSQTYSDLTAACGMNSYRVYAYNLAGNSVYAATSGTTAPCKPVVSARPGATTVNLAWTAVSGAQGYTVEKWDVGPANFVLIKSLTLADPTSYVVTGLMKTTPYQFRVVAKSTLGDTPSDPVNVVTLTFEVFIPLSMR